jgi:hypothetical protein
MQLESSLVKGWGAVDVEHQQLLVAAARVQA